LLITKLRNAFRLRNTGIGRVTSNSLSKAGWSVVLFARNTKELEVTAKSCSGPTLIVNGDVSKEEDVVRLFLEAVDKFGIGSFFSRG
jgi:NAD(P)-dependent dehydrogenase (short-subunit alcohol dehydrogenase family)